MHVDRSLVSPVLYEIVDNTSNLHQEPQSVSVNLGLLDQPGSQVVSTGPLAEFTNVLTVQRDSLSPKLVELVSSQNNLGAVNGRREDSKLEDLSCH